eukprot:TRINITY_DN3498_c0_g3_i1.p1 TRINITY_DN3498_c0_g3~~TRINITY_DN3498_c0_g3_i1.p1  ORF type:complete len:334 (-),score=61.78 TRINITY_DN3498_c0_g3_i1:260-1219(-)
MNMMIIQLSLVLLFIQAIFAGNVTKIVPGAAWYDQNGDRISAHGAGILFYNNVYYWYGEAEDPNHLGVACYSSTDLLNWVNRGIVFTVSAASNGTDTDYIIERPKVLYNNKTNTFVMWMHHDNSDYTLAHTAVAVSSDPGSTFTFVSSFLPNGNQSRDMTVYQDDDGTAYLIRASGHTNLGIAVSPLSSDYLTVLPQSSYIDQSREAPALLKYQGLYYLVLSHCSGWAYNAADLWVSNSLNSTWKELGNPTGNSTTYDSQSTFFLPLSGKAEGHFMFMADRWNYPNLAEASYIWLPVVFNGANLQIPWYNEWDFSIFNN